MDFGFSPEQELPRAKRRHEEWNCWKLYGPGGACGGGVPRLLLINSLNVS
jgi:hypothetical protein